MSRSVSPSESDRAVDQQLGSYSHSRYQASRSSEDDSEPESNDVDSDEEKDSGEIFHVAQEEHDEHQEVSEQALPSSIDEDATSQAICRICLDGPQSESEGGESLGRLLSPCRCKGTMKYVHATCLDRWRAMSARASSIVACDQCGAPYRFRKSRFVGIATSPALLFGLSIFLFLLLIWTVGVIATFWMDVHDGSETRIQQESKSARWPWRGSKDRNDDTYSNDDWLEPDVSMSYSNYWNYGGLIYEPIAYVKLIKEAVRQFTSGEAAEAVRGVVGFNTLDTHMIEPPAEPSSEGFWSALKREWMYGDGGLYQGQSAGESPASSIAMETESFTPVAEKYDARRASTYDPSARLKTSRGRGTSRKASLLKSLTSRPNWLNKIVLQFSLGFSLVGILSFVNLLLGASFLGPFNLHNFGLGRSFARMTNSHRRSSRSNGAQDGVNIASILIVVLVMIGVVRALHLVYKAVRSLSRRFLSRLEEAIIDWQSVDDEAAQQHAAPASQAHTWNPDEPANLEI